MTAEPLYRAGQIAVCPKCKRRLFRFVVDVCEHEIMDQSQVEGLDGFQIRNGDHTLCPDCGTRYMIRGHVLVLSES